MLSDETISAFLDAELSPEEMSNIRQQIQQDSVLAERIETFATLNLQLKEHFNKINDRPLPSSLIEKIESSRSNKATAEKQESTLIPFPQRLGKILKQHMAIAASVVALVGVGIVYVLPDSSLRSEQQEWQEIVKLLDSTSSGKTITLTNEKQLTPVITFYNTKGMPCRQYHVTTPNVSKNDYIACRNKQQWKVVFSLKSTLESSGEYATASKSPELDSAIDRMISGSVLSPDEENKQIKKHWQTKKN